MQEVELKKENKTKKEAKNVILISCSIVWGMQALRSRGIPGHE